MTTEPVPVKCPKCDLLIGKVEGKKGNDDPNWPTDPPDTIHLMCPDCVEEDALEKGYTVEQAKATRDRRTEALEKMTWLEGGATNAK